jgi:hypothetical protein
MESECKPSGKNGIKKGIKEGINIEWEVKRIDMVRRVRWRNKESRFDI